MAKSMQLKRAVRRAMPDLTPEMAAVHVAAATVCLHDQGHTNGTRLPVSGSVDNEYNLLWDTPNAAMRKTHVGREATEEGAVAIAVAIIAEATDYIVVERSVQGTGFDYWLGHQSGVLEASLEVSGIRAGTNAQVANRLMDKQKQMRKGDERRLPGYAVVVEFSAPQACIGEK